MKIIYSPESEEQLEKLQRNHQIKAYKVIEKLQIFGLGRVDSSPLRDGVFELRNDDVRVYYSYAKGGIIIIAIVVLKKSQKAPDRYIEQAKRIIKRIKTEYNLE